MCTDSFVLTEFFCRGYMLDAGSLLNNTEELDDLARQKNLIIIGVTKAWLHDGFRDDEI